MSIPSVDVKAVFAFAAFAAAISSFGVLYPSSFADDSATVSFRELVREMRGAGCVSGGCTLKGGVVAWLAMSTHLYFRSTMKKINENKRFRVRASATISFHNSP